MNPNLPHKVVFTYFRMGLVTGLVDKPEVVAWADEQILRGSTPGDEIIELSLSGRQSYSQIVWLLNSFQGEPEYDLSLRLLLGRAGLLLAADPQQASRIIVGLRLLNEEQYLPGEIKTQVVALKDDLDRHQQGLLTFEELVARLSGFLEGYCDDRRILE